MKHQFLVSRSVNRYTHALVIISLILSPLFAVDIAKAAVLPWVKPAAFVSQGEATPTATDVASTATPAESATPTASATEPPAATLPPTATPEPTTISVDAADVSGAVAEASVAPAAVTATRL